MSIIFTKFNRNLSCIIEQLLSVTGLIYIGCILVFVAPFVSYYDFGIQLNFKNDIFTITSVLIAIITFVIASVTLVFSMSDSYYGLKPKEINQLRNHKLIIEFKHEV